MLLMMIETRLDDLEPAARDRVVQYLVLRYGLPSPVKSESEEELERLRGRDSRRKALQRQPDLRDAIKMRDGGMCRYCGRDVDWSDRRGQVGGCYDHVDPEGQNVYDNLVVACRGCNSAKGSRTPEQWGVPLRPLPSGLSPGLDPGLDPGPNPEQSRGSDRGITLPVVPPKVLSPKRPEQEKKPSEVHRLIKLYEELYYRRYNRKPLIHSGKDPAILKRMSDHYGAEIDTLMREFFQTADLFVEQAGHTIGVFQSVADKLATASQRGGARPLKPGNLAAIRSFVARGEDAHEDTGSPSLRS